MTGKDAVKAMLDESTENACQLGRAIKQAQKSGQAIRAWAPLLERELQRCERLQGKIDEAFGGQPFLSDQSPMSPKNQRRFKRYFEMMKSMTKLKIYLIRELMRVHGVDPNNPHQMWEPPIFVGGIAAAGAPAGASHQQTSDARLTSSEPPPKQYSEEVLSLARHLDSLAYGINGAHKANSAVKAGRGAGKTSDGPRVH